MPLDYYRIRETLRIFTLYVNIEGTTERSCDHPVPWKLYILPKCLFINSLLQHTLKSLLLARHYLPLENLELRAKNYSTLDKTLLQNALTDNEAKNCNLIANIPLRTLENQM